MSIFKKSGSTGLLIYRDLRATYPRIIISLHPKNTKNMGKRLLFLDKSVIIPV